MPLLGSSQNVYPSKSIVNGDTVVLFSPSQAIAIYSNYIELDWCKELRDTLKSVIKKQDVAISIQKEVIDNTNSQLALSRIIIKSDEEILITYQKIDKKSARTIKWLRIQRNVLSVLSLALIIVVLVK